MGGYIIIVKFFVTRSLYMCVSMIPFGGLITSYINCNINIMLSMILATTNSAKLNSRLCA